MPFFTLPIGADGPVLNAGIAVSVPYAEALVAEGEDVPMPVRIRALVDTGASCTCVDPSVLAQLNLTPTGQTMMSTPSTGDQPHPTNVYDISLAIPGATENDQPLIIPAMPVAESVIPVEGVLALIGRDILNECLLAYNGPMREFILAF